MNYLNRNSISVFVLTSIIVGMSFGAPAKKQKVSRSKMTRTEIQTKNNSRQAEADGKVTRKKKYYFYDEVTDAYIGQIIKQANGLFRNGDHDQAIALLIKEQARLDKKGRKVNAPGKYVKISSGAIVRVRDGEKSDLPLADESQVPRMPSPLIMTLMTVRMDDGQCPLEMVEYYQSFSKNYQSDKSSIFAASQAVSLQGFSNQASWEFVDTTFDQSEKNLLIQQFIALSFSTTKVCISQNDFKIALEKIAPIVVPKSIQQYYASLGKTQQDIIESHFWKYCPQWAEYNVQNRLKRALQYQHEKKYTDAYRLYEAILDRYSDQEKIFTKVQTIYIEAKFEQALWHRDHKRYAQAIEVYDTIREEYPQNKVLQNKIQYACLESRVEEILLSNQNYQKLTDVLGEYKALFEKDSEYIEKAYGIKVLCGVFSKDSENARRLIQDKSLLSQLFAGSRILPLLNPAQRMAFDTFTWENCSQWKEYNQRRQYGYAAACFRYGKYSDSIHFYERLYSRYQKTFPQDVRLSYIRSAIRAEENELALSLLKGSENIGKTQQVVASDVLWLLQNGKASSASDFLSGFNTLFRGNSPLNVEMKFYLAYSLLLDGKPKESQKVFIEMKKDHPGSLYTLKMSYLSKQRERLQGAFKFTQKDQFSGLINKAGKCFDEGELEMALGIYLRIFAEYADRQEESSRACYLLGYYYLLSGDFEASNEILVFLQKQYKTTAYAKEADVLIQRIKDFTAS